MPFDWKNPDYVPEFRRRLELLERLRTDKSFDLAKAYYRDNPEDFINDFGMTYDPRNVERGLPAAMPFILFDKQREFVECVIEHWRAQKPLIVEKSRDGGMSWLTIGLGCTLCILYDGMRLGYGSRKEEYVDKVDEPKSLFWKARFFMRHLPKELRAGWNEAVDAPFMRLKFPDTGASMGGEAGDDIGRGDRVAIYFFDESAHHPRQKMVDMALSQTTNCRIDVSSVNGPTNSFAVRRHSGKIDVFIFDWRDDPRKDDAWYAKQCEELDPIVVAQEIDRDYQASVEGVVIPAAWIRSAIDAVQALGISLTGARGLALDVADEGKDKNAALGATGVEIDFLDQWSGKGADLYATTERAFRICEDEGYLGFRYDADGLGAGVRGDARVLNEQRKRNGRRAIPAEGFRGSEGVWDPEGIVEGTIGLEGDKGRTNKDYFANRKAQGWWALRKRFQMVHRWRTRGIPCNPDEIISINSKKCGPLLQHLINELGQPTFATNTVGKILIDKAPEGLPSPNLADGAMIKFAPMETPLPDITPDMISQIRVSGMMQRGRRR